MSKLIAKLAARRRALYVTLTCLVASAFIAPAAALAEETGKPAEPATTSAAAIAGEGAKSLIGFLWAVLPYLIGVAIVMFIARWLMKKFGFSHR